MKDCEARRLPECKHICEDCAIPLPSIATIVQPKRSYANSVHAVQTDFYDTDGLFRTVYGDARIMGDGGPYRRVVTMSDGTHVEHKVKE